MDLNKLTKKLLLISFLISFSFQGLAETMTPDEYYASLDDRDTSLIEIVVFALGAFIVLVLIPVLIERFKDNREIKRRRKMDEDRKKP